MPPVGKKAAGKRTAAEAKTAPVSDDDDDDEEEAGEGGDSDDDEDVGISLDAGESKPSVQ